MAKYGKKAQEKVEDVMHEYKRGELKSGPEGKGGTVQSREQAIAIGLSEAREEGAKVPNPDSNNGGTSNMGAQSSNAGAASSAKGGRKSSGKKAAKKAAPKKAAKKAAKKK